MPLRTESLLAIVLSVIPVVTGSAQDFDWPQFLGPNRDGRYTGYRLPRDGPTTSHQRCGGSWSVRA